MLGSIAGAHFPVGIRFLHCGDGVPDFIGEFRVPVYELARQQQIVLRVITG